MANARVTLNMAGVKELLNADEVIADCMERAARMADNANGRAPKHGYTSSEPFASAEGKTKRGNRCAVVYTRTDIGKRMQAKHNTLTSAIDAGR